MPSLWAWGGCWETWSSTALTLNLKIKGLFLPCLQDKDTKNCERENVHVIPQNSCQSMFVFWEKVRESLTFFFYLGKDYLSILKCTALLVLAHIACPQRERRNDGIFEVNSCWGFSVVVEGVKLLEQPQHTLDTNLMTIIPRKNVVVTAWAHCSHPAGVHSQLEGSMPEELDLLL